MICVTPEQAQREIVKHDFDTVVDNPPSIAEGGTGVVVPGCPQCKKRFNTMHQFTSHIADDVLPLNFSYQREPREEG